MTSMFDLITLTDRASVMHLAWASRFEILIHAKASDCHSFEVSAQFRDILLFFLMPKLTLLLLNWWYAKEPANNGMQIRQNALKWVLIYKTFPGVTPQNPHLGWKSRGRGVTCTKCPVKCPLFFLKLCPVLCPVFFVDYALVTVTVIVVTGVLKLFCPSFAGCKLLFIERFILNIWWCGTFLEHTFS